MRNKAEALIANIPHSYIAGLGTLLGRLLYFLAIPQRRTVRRNLRFIHPEWSRSQIQRFSKRNFQHYGITCLEIAQSVFSSREDILAKFRISGEEHLLQALDQKKGVIIVSAHLGNYEMALQYPACHLQRPLTGVAKKLRHRLLNRWIHQSRTRLGNKIIYKKGALPAMIQTLRRGELLGILIDQSRYALGLEVDFLGRRATATSAPAMLALRCKSPVVPVFCTREADGVLAIQVEPPLDLTRTKDLRSDLRINTQKMAAAVENAVRKCPEQWFWFQRRWKKHYPHLYPEYQARQRRRSKQKKRQTRSATA
ncbi:MAG: lysophospholipid acyltransferase family protein [Desulfobacterales bacterium]|nr:MAG: lysophospholipid acyltransferase family protein [Desulfobacterales bacterium]